MMISRSRPIPLAEHGSAEWHAARQRGIGASEAAAACGLSAYQTPLELWGRKVGRLDGPELSAAMVRGTRFEPIILQYASEAVGLALKPGPQTLYRHAEHEWLLATPDGEFDDGGQTILECKSSVAPRVIEGLGEEGSDEVPVEYLMQCQQQLAVTGAQTCVLCVVIPDRWKFFDFRIHRVERHEGLIASIVQTEADLWQHVINETEPAPDFGHRSCLQLMQRLYAAPGDETEIIDLDDEHVGEWSEYERLGKEMNALKERRDVCKAKVLHAIGDAAGGVLGDGRMVRRKLTQRAGYTVEPTEFIDVRAVKVPKGMAVRV